MPAGDRLVALSVTGSLPEPVEARIRALIDVVLDTLPSPLSETQVATIAAQAVATAVGAAPGQLDTIDELAAALGDDANYAATVTAAIATARAYALDRAHHTGTQSATTVEESADRKWLTLAERTKLGALVVGAVAGAPTGLSNLLGLQPLAGHVTPPSGGSQLSDGSQTQETYSTAHVVTDDATSLALAFSNWCTNGSTEVDNPNPITIAASVELPDGTVVPLAWNGARSTTLAPGADSDLTDPVYVELRAGEVIYTRTHVLVATAGQTWPLGSSTTSPAGIYNAKSGKVTGSNATLASSPTWASPGNAAYGPSVIVGRTLAARRPIVAIVGASNTYGYGDVADSVLGFSERACQAQRVSFVKIAKPGEAGGSFAASITARRRRLRYIAGATHAILGYGLNDLGAGGTTFAQIAKMVLDNAGYLARLGVARTYFVTLAPRSTSTDGYATTANQTTTTVSNYNTTRAAVNAWARAGFPTVNGAAAAPGTANAVPSPLLAGIIEMADFVETGRDTGIWKAGATTDGTHAADHVGLAGIVPTFRLDAADTTVTVTPGAGVAPPAATAPGAPTALTATPGAGQASLSWTAPASTGGSPVTDYVIEYKTSAATAWSVFADGTSTGTSAIVTGLTNGTAYDFRVSAVNAVGTSATSATAAATPAAPSQSYSPLNLPGLQAWYDPSTIAQANDTDVASLADSGPNGYTATQATAATRPKLRTGANGIGGKSALWFDTVRHLVSALPADTTPFTLVVTIAPVSTGNRTVVGSQSAGGRQVRVAGATAGTQAAVLVKQGTAVMATQSNANTYTEGVLSVTWDGANVVFRFNGVTQPVGAITAAAFTAGVLTVIGARDTANGDAFNGKMGDLVQCSGVLSAANLAAEEQRQAAKYSIAIAA